jgi:hypothetical protein
MKRDLMFDNLRNSKGKLSTYDEADKKIDIVINMAKTEHAGSRELFKNNLLFIIFLALFNGSYTLWALLSLLKRAKRTE